MTIFISIASYRDSELSKTITSAINNAEHPEDLYFGVVYQGTEREKPDLSYVNNLSIIEMHPKFAKGAGYARSLAMGLYKDEDYFLQIDSHTRFVPGWDTKSISELNKAKEISNNQKIILSYFPSAFIVEGSKDTVLTKSNDHATYPMIQVPVINNLEKWGAKRLDFEDKDRKFPELSKTVLGGYIFSDGSIVKEVPYDPEISFFGEEICFAVRAWTRGWDIYSPSIDICYHFYLRGFYPRIWQDENLKGLSWKELEAISEKKQKNVLCGIQNDIYGVGTTRSIEEYEKFVNLNFKKHYGLTNDF